MLAERERRVRAAESLEISVANNAARASNCLRVRAPRPFTSQRGKPSLTDAKVYRRRCLRRWRRCSVYIYREEASAIPLTLGK